MTYKSFKTTKRKYPNLWEKVFGFNSDIYITEFKEDKLYDNLDRIRLVSNTNRKLIELSTPWEAINLDDNTNPSVIFAWKNYEIEFDNTNENFINSIKPTFLLRFAGGESVNKEELLEEGFITYFDRIVFTKRESSIVMDAGVMLQHSLQDEDNLGFKEDIEIKMILYITNPNTYS